MIIDGGSEGYIRTSKTYDEYFNITKTNNKMKTAKPRLINGILSELDKLERIKHDDEKIIERVRIKEGESKIYYLGCFIKIKGKIELRYIIDDNGVVRSC